MTQPETQEPKPKSFSEAAASVMAPTAAVEEKLPMQVEDLTDEDAEEGSAKPQTDAIPAWAKIPVGLVMPDGWQVHFILLRASWTNKPSLGDRSVILWNLTEADEKLAAKRARGDANRIIDEMSKQMIRVIDGGRTDWSRGAGSNVERFWDEIGGKCRHILRSYYLKTHTMEVKDMADFFDNCVAVRTHTG